MSSAADRSYGTVFKHEPEGKASAAFIMLHGLGDTGAGWTALSHELKLEHIKWVFPTAPTIPVTLNQGYRMPAWYDLPQNMVDVVAKTFDKDGINASVKYVRELVDEQIQQGIPANRIVIGGFSQGGHVAYKAALLHEPRIAACVALSTYMDPLGAQEVLSANLGMPIFVAHGTDDMVVPQMMCDISVNLLKERGVTAMEVQRYSNMGHSSCPQEMADLKNFLNKHLAPQQ